MKELFCYLLFFAVINIFLVLIPHNAYAKPCCAKRVYYTSEDNKTKITGCQKVVNCLYAGFDIVLSAENPGSRLNNTSGYCPYCCPIPVFDREGQRIPDNSVSIGGESHLTLTIGILYQRIEQGLQAASQQPYHFHPEGYLEKWLMPMRVVGSFCGPEMLIFPNGGQYINYLLDANQQLVPLSQHDAYPIVDEATDSRYVTADSRYFAGAALTIPKKASEDNIEDYNQQVEVMVAVPSGAQPIEVVADESLSEIVSIKNRAAKAIALTCLGVQRMFFNAWGMNMDDPKAGCQYCRGIGKALMARVYQFLKHYQTRKDDDQNAKVIRALGDELYSSCPHFVEEGIVLLGECQNLDSILGGHKEIFPDQAYVDRIFYENALSVNSNEDVGEAAVKEYADSEKRISSFQGFSDTQGWGGHLPNAQDMAEAGLFYTGVGDFARCFECGVCLFKWSPSDNPVKKHACYYPACSFLKTFSQNSGQQRDYADGLQQFHALQNKYLKIKSIEVEQRELSKQMEDRKREMERKQMELKEQMEAAQREMERKQMELKEQMEAAQREMERKQLELKEQMEVEGKQMEL